MYRNSSDLNSANRLIDPALKTPFLSEDARKAFIDRR